MSETPDLLAGIEVMEAMTFRVGQMARSLRTDHPDLMPCVQSLRGSTHTSGAAQLNLHAVDPDGAKALAARLGIELDQTINRGVGTGGFEHLDGEAEINGVTVVISGIRLIDATEWSALQTEQPTAERIVGALDSEQLVQGPQAPAELEKDTPGLVEPVVGAAFTPEAVLRTVAGAIEAAFRDASAGPTHSPPALYRAAAQRLLDAHLIQSPETLTVGSVPLVVFVAEHPGESPLGFYATERAARARCEAAFRSEYPAGVVLALDWIGDDSEPLDPWELVAEVGDREEQPTGYAVTPFRVDADHSPGADS
ncbi:hypothetical protein ACWC0A_18080 [Streptomyces scopuliridis]